MVEDAKIKNQLLRLFDINIALLSDYDDRIATQVHFTLKRT